MAENLIPLEPYKYYHIFNHAIGNENFFESDDDYNWFLKKLKKYVVPVSDIIAFCLLPNHFHIVARIKSDAEIAKVLIENSVKRITADDVQKNNNGCIEEFTSRQYGNLFNSYAKYYNYIHHRKGTLFTRAFRRKHVEDENYLKQLICYVHQNPVEAGFSKHLSEWKYSSYNAITGQGATLICRNEVIEMFNTVENFIFCSTKTIELEVERTL